MENWQKGADLVLKLSSEGKKRYFDKFPERKAWFEANHPQHFGRSVAGASSSLKKVTKAKVKKQRLAAIRQAAEKRDQAAVLTPERRLMAQRRLTSGEGLAGGMDTVADIKKSIAAGMAVRSGGLGSLFEQDDKIEKKGNKYYLNGVAYNSEKEAINALASKSKASVNQKIPEKDPDFLKSQQDYEAQEFETNKGILSNINSINQAIKDFEALRDKEAAKTQDWMNKQGYSGRNWPKPGEDPNWDKYMDVGTLKQQLMTPSSGVAYRNERGELVNYSRGNRRPLEIEKNVADDIAQAERSLQRERKPNYGDKGMFYEEETNLAKELAEKIIEEKRLQECMPMAIMIKKSSDEDNKWDYADSWEKNPIKKGSTESEAEDEPGEYDYEGDMAKSQLRSIMHNSKMLHDMLEDTTNLPEWVQSKITLAEDYILTAANYMRGELENMEEEYMGFKKLKAKIAAKGGVRDPEAVAAAIGRKKYGKEKFQAAAAAGKKLGEEAEIDETDLPFDPNAQRPEMPAGKQPAEYRYVRGLARKAMKAGIAAAEQPMSHEDLHAQHQALHVMGEEIEQIEEKMSVKARMMKSAKSDDLVKRSMLPDRSGIPAGKGYGDDLKKEKIMKKVGKVIQKKRMARPTDNPSANELVPQSMLPDVPGYPQGYEMNEEVVEQVVEQPVEQQIETPVVEENVSPFVSAGSKFLTRTSARLVYGDKND